MPRIRFARDFVFHLHPLQTVLYRAGETHLVKQACAEQALACGAGVEAGRPATPAEKTDDAAGR